MNYVDVLIWNGSARYLGRLTYENTLENLQKGDWVSVPFRNKTLLGLVLKLHNEKPDFKTQSIIEKTERERVESWKLNLAEWMIEYYFCSEYDALKTVIAEMGNSKRKLKERVSKATQNPPHLLNPIQAEIIADWKKNEPKLSLLWGVTGSGKTEIYRHLIAETVKNGKHALLLLPEISLTPNFFRYFESQFPRLILWHSRMTPAQKKRQALQVHEGAIDLVIGSRSALFAPFKNLGLIIMDEEHETAYKQDSSPRYHAKTVALKMSEILNIPVMLGSATPSIETITQIRDLKAPVYRMIERASEVPAPKITVVDMRIELQKGHKNMFSDELEQKISSTMARGDQVMLFLNRRGSAAITLCRDCGYVPNCPNCERPLVHHTRNFSRPILLCHHCGLTETPPTTCAHCKSIRIRHTGLGTERLEEEICRQFPKARLLRMDQDSTHHIEDWEKTLHQIHEGAFDILIGTQMITKGWDLPRVTLMGIVLADLGMHMPDFRGQERHFQLLTQAAGRPGRRDVQGEVVIQTYNPESPSIQALAGGTMDDFYETERRNRLQAKLPPYSKIIKLGFQSEEWKKGRQSIENMEKTLNTIIEQEKLDVRISSAPALFPKKQGSYHWNILLEGQNPAIALQKTPTEILRNFKIDVDPSETV